jgi:hypothetical protein
MLYSFNRRVIALSRTTLFPDAPSDGGIVAIADDAFLSRVQSVLARVGNATA